MLFLIIPAVAAGLTLIFFLTCALIANGMAMTNRVPLFVPDRLATATFMNVHFPSRVDRIRIRGWYIKSVNPNSRKTVILLHGGKQNRADQTIDLIHLSLDLGQQGFNVLSFDRRGCGESEAASFRERACFDRDVIGAIDFMLSLKPGEKIFLLGTSVGAVVALTAASKDPRVSGVIADCCFKSHLAMGRRVLSQTFKPFIVFAPMAVQLGPMVCGLEQSNAIYTTQRVKCPILFINGDADSVVPPDDAEELKSLSAHQLSEVWIVPGAGHSLPYKTDPQGYINKVKGFLDKCPVDNTFQTEVPMNSSAAVQPAKSLITN
ncbi:MAG: alpha/beta hydrolase [Dehalogenimonas sp.]